MDMLTLDASFVSRFTMLEDFLMSISALGIFAVDAPPQSFSGMVDALWQSVYGTLHSFITFLPNLVGAIVILGLGWFVSLLLAKLMERGLQAIGMERVGDYSGLNPLLQRSGSQWTTSHAIAVLLKWSIFLIFVQAAATLLGVPQVTQVIAISPSTKFGRPRFNQRFSRPPRTKRSSRKDAPSSDEKTTTSTSTPRLPSLPKTTSKFGGAQSPTVRKRRERSN